MIPLYGIEGCPRPEPRSGIPLVRVRAPTQEVYPRFIVRRVLRNAAQAFAGCYRQSEAHRQCRNVVLRARFAIEGHGRPSAVAVTGELDSGCVEEVLRGLRFPDPVYHQRVWVRTPLELRVRR